MRKVVPALAIFFIATLGANSAVQAAVVDFGAAAVGGTLTFGGGPTLDKSSSLDFDGALLVVSNIGASDQSGLTVFPAGTHNTVKLSGPIDFGSGSGVVINPLIGIDITWTGDGGDLFTEKLTTVVDIDRAAMNAITVTVTGTLSDLHGLFLDTPAELILGVTEAGGPGHAISASMTNAASNAPEPSTWVMMALGFIGLGYAAVRRGSRDRSLAI
jgi:hypothetical protein